MSPDRVMRSRAIERQISGIATSDGAGVKLTRVIGQSLQRRLDPFLMLDAFGSEVADDYIGGFPDHPHRGFETVTYMLAGRMRHRDSRGNEGLLQPGGAQWMSAGRGLIHSEMPEQSEGRMEGFQLWLNLPASEKMGKAWYRDIQAEQIPEFVTDSGVRVRVIAGASHGVAGAISRPITAPIFLDLQLPAGSRFEQSLPAGHNAFLTVYRGELAAGPDFERVAERRTAILANDQGADGIVLASCGEARAILVAGAPLSEPIVQHGPFVMNTRLEIEQAIADYREGRLA